MDEIYDDWRIAPPGELTPEEIAERAAIERAAHLAKKRGERPPVAWPYTPEEISMENLAVEDLMGE